MGTTSSVLVVNKKSQAKVFIRLDPSLPGCELTIVDTFSLSVRQPFPITVRVIRVLVSHIDVVNSFLLKQ